MEIVVQNLAITADAGVLANRDLLPGVNCRSTYSHVITNLNLCSRSTGYNDRPAVKANQIAEKAALDGDVLSDLQLGAALVENNWYTL